MRSLPLRPGDSLTTPRVALSMGSRSVGLPSSCHPSYRGFWFLPPVGLAPTERASLRWSHPIAGLPPHHQAGPGPAVAPEPDPRAVCLLPAGTRGGICRSLPSFDPPDITNGPGIPSPMTSELTRECALESHIATGQSPMRRYVLG
jgi:hypothetical protein